MYHYTTENILNRYADDPHVGKIISILVENKSIYEALPSDVVCDLDRLVIKYRYLHNNWYHECEDGIYEYEPSAEFKKAYIQQFEDWFEGCPDELRLLCLAYILFRVTCQLNQWQDADDLSHTDTIRSILQNHIFEDLLLNQNYSYIVMYAVFRLLDRNRGRYDMEEYEEKILEQIQDAFVAVRRNFLACLRMRSGLLKQDLVAAAFHPNRVEKWLEKGGFEVVDMMM
jgi:hypothetical protein